MLSEVKYCEERESGIVPIDFPQTAPAHWGTSQGFIGQRMFDDGDGWLDGREGGDFRLFL